MSANKIAQKKVSELKNMSFFVPAYQRGYRWTKDEVKALLDDIWEFDTQGNLEYCIQPLIIKPFDGKYEVVDGQQRLTTIYIFMKLAQEKTDAGDPIYSIEYKTRNDSKIFLRSLTSEICKNKEKIDENIDYYFMGCAYNEMLDWVAEKVNNTVGKDETGIIKELYGKINNSVFFIWYELSEDSKPIEMFSRVNMGKIPLTNAELIKALLLNSENFVSENASKRQIEISVSWDKIEQELHNDSLWYFLNDLNERANGETRIDMIFRLLAKEYNDKLKLDDSQQRFTFNVFYAVLKEADDKEEAVKKIWNKTENKFEQMKSWYEDYNQYHLIGYLLSQERTIFKIENIIGNKGKKETLKALRDEIKNDYPIEIKSDNGKNVIVHPDVENLTYGPDSPKIRRVLLMFNIAALLCGSDKQTRFPFDVFKNENWDLEHIHATADESADPDDSFDNLTLLSEDINRSYKNAPFVEKRKKIIEYEKMGYYIPLCTRNVFLKYYTETITDFKMWNDEDKQYYIKAIKDTLEKFFTTDKWFDRKKGKNGNKNDNAGTAQ